MNQFGTTTGPLSDEDCKVLVDDIFNALQNPNEPSHSPNMAAQIQIWAEIKSRAESDKFADAYVDLVKAGHIKLHHTFPQKVNAYLHELDTTARQRRLGGGDGGSGDQGGYQRQPQQGGSGGGGYSRYR